MNKLVRMLILSAVLAASVAEENKTPPFAAITDEEIAKITFEDSANDNGWVAPVAKDLTELESNPKKQKSFNEWWDKVEEWPNAKSEDTVTKVCGLIDVAALVDLDRGQFEAETAYSVFAKLTKEVPKADLVKATAWMVLKPEECPAITTAPDIGIPGPVKEEKVRARAALYAKKLLGRLEGKLPAKE
jgi:hypothetical protein